MNLGRGATLPPPASVEYDRFIVEAFINVPAQYYKKGGLSWVNMTPQQTSIEFVEYAAADLVATFESQL